MSADQRYYTATAGRFYTPDPSSGVDFKNPITWNKYVYAGDDPVNFNDRRGLMMNLVDEGGGGGGEWWCEGPWDPLCFGDPGTDPATGVGFAPAPRQGPTLDDERKKRAAAIAAAIAAIAKKLGDQVTTKIWPTEIKLYSSINLPSMCSMKDPYGNYELKVTYQVISDLGTVMTTSDLDGFSITESFLGGSFANGLNSQASTWSREMGNLNANGTFYDYLAIGSPFPTSGTAYQEFTAAGWFGTQPLDITGFGSVQTNGVNFNIYAPKNVTVNGMSGSAPCRF